MTDKVVAIYQNILNLADTTLEGLEHIQAMTNHGRFEETMLLYTDVADSMHEIQSALAAAMPDYEQSDLQHATKRVVESMQMIMAAFEGDKDVRPMEVMQFAMLPAYHRWHKELQQELLEYCAPSMH